MIPIQDVLHRIRWDPACRGSLFEIDYIDRVAGGIVRVPFNELHLDGGAIAALALRDKDGAVVRIPLHRVCEVRRDGRVVWARAGPGARWRLR